MCPGYNVGSVHVLRNSTNSAHSGVVYTSQHILATVFDSGPSNLLKCLRHEKHCRSPLAHNVNLFSREVLYKSAFWHGLITGAVKASNHITVCNDSAEHVSIELVTVGIGRVPERSIHAQAIHLNFQRCLCG